MHCPARRRPPPGSAPSRGRAGPRRTIPAGGGMEASLGEHRSGPCGLVGPRGGGGARPSPPRGCRGGCGAARAW
jgi:hypothetical protein